MPKRMVPSPPSNAQAHNLDIISTLFVFFSLVSTGGSVHFVLLRSETKRKEEKRRMQSEKHTIDQENDHASHILKKKPSNKLVTSS